MGHYDVLRVGHCKIGARSYHQRLQCARQISFAPITNQQIFPCSMMAASWTAVDRASSIVGRESIFQTVWMAGRGARSA